MPRLAGKPRGQTVSTELPVPMIEALDRYADQEERSRSWVIRKAVQEFLRAREGPQGN